jgi:hypothetical protein
MVANPNRHLDHPLLREAWETRDIARRRRARLAIGVSVTVTVVWAIAVTVYGLWPRVLGNWPASITMVFGSIVAGSTPQGGGAVAFPVFTKLLEVPAEVARSFSLCIQTIGMSAAALSIVINRRAVEWRTVAITTSAAAIAFGLVILAGVRRRLALPAVAAGRGLCEGDLHHRPRGHGLRGLHRHARQCARGAPRAAAAEPAHAPDADRDRRAGGRYIGAGRVGHGRVSSTSRLSSSSPSTPRSVCRPA